MVNRLCSVPTKEMNQYASLASLGDDVYHEPSTIALEAHMAKITQQLVSDAPDIETVRTGIPSLSLYDLRDLGGPVGDAAQRRIAADEGAQGDL